MVLKNREHINYRQESIDADTTLIAGSLGGGALLVACCIVTLLIYFSTKANRKQLNLMIFGIILTRLMLGALSMMRGIILLLTNELKFGSFSKMGDNCVTEAGIEYSAMNFHLFLAAVWLREIAEASKNPMISAIRSRYINVVFALVIAVAYTALLYQFLPLEREIVLLCAPEKGYIMLNSILPILYLAFLIYFYWISKRQKALQPLMAKNQYYQQIYLIVKYYNIVVVIYQSVCWALIMALVHHEDVFDSTKMQTTVGKALTLWISYGILLEFIPLFIHLHFLRSTSKFKKGSSAVKDYVVTDVIFDSLRELIVEYLIKGINKELQKHVRASFAYGKEWPALGSVGNRRPGDHQVEVDESDVVRDSLEEELHCFPFQRDEDLLSSKEFLLDDVVNMQKYVEVTVIAPNLFRHFRKFFGIEDGFIASTFSVDKLRSGDLQIRLGTGRGGSFFIFPSNSRFLLKAIKGKEMEIVKQTLVDYFLHLVKCERSYINPIIGLFTINIKGENMIEPLHFMMMPNVLPFERVLLSEETRILQFDLKGSLGQRSNCAQPLKLLRIEELSEKELEETYKDVDFLKSYRCLELSAIEAQPIVAQLRLDTRLLSRVKLFDYSIMLFMASIPLFQHVDIRNAKGALPSVQDPGEGKPKGLSVSKRLPGRDSPTLVTMKVKPSKVDITFNSSLWLLHYHVRDPSDVEVIHAYIRAARGSVLREKQPTIVHSRAQSSLPSFIEESKDDLEGEEQKERFLAQAREDEDKPLFDFKQFPIPDKNQRIINFPVHLLVDDNTDYCTECLNRPRTNHILIIDAKEGVRSLGVHQLVLKMEGDREVIHLLNSHFEIIDYLTKFSLKKRLEKSLKTTIMKEPSVEEPKRYSERFLKCIKTVFTKHSV